MALGTGARALEILGIRGVDLDWGDQLVKGTQDERWLPVSAEAFVWIRLCLNDLGTLLDPNDGLGWTLRRRNRGDEAHANHDHK